MMHWWWQEGAWWMHAVGWIGMLLVWALVILGIVWLVRALQGGADRTTAGRTEEALEILRQRYARGEIDAEEYEARRRTLG